MQLIIIGVGGHGQVIQEAAKETNKYIKVEIVFLDDRYRQIGDCRQLYIPPRQSHLAAV